ncbi:MAG: hypothetical protein LCH32_06105 [Bacteroidetes bacterium]|jgi:hypothetical protein|nr:hypothetical protein [Bacteroidota bacterium]
MKYNIVIRALAYSLLLLGCKKFDDDPTISLSRAKVRILATSENSSWQIENIVIDGVNANNIYQDSINPINLHELHFYFINGRLNEEDDPNAFVSSTPIKPGIFNPGDITSLNYVLNSKFETLNFTERRIKDSSVTKALFTNFLSFGTNHIKRLYGKKMILTKTIKNKFYEITFKR